MEATSQPCCGIVPRPATSAAMANRRFLEICAHTPLGQGRGRLLAPVRWLVAVAVIGVLFIDWLGVGVVHVALVLGWFVFLVHTVGICALVAVLAGGGGDLPTLAESSTAPASPASPGV